MTPTKLSKKEIETCQKDLNDWTLSKDDHYLEKEFIFHDFQHAWDFMCSVATLAEKYNHHPNWSNVYNHVHICLTTHDSGGLTKLDFTFAAQIDQLLNVPDSHNSIN